MSQVCGKVAVVTGAGSGIGRALAMELARRGAKLAISDVNMDGLNETQALLKEFGTEVHVKKVDVSQLKEVSDYANEVALKFGVIHQLYNNAGIAGVSSDILNMQYEDFERVMGINYWGVLYGTKEFLPYLIQSGDGHLINFSSLNGILAQPAISAYCSAKFAVRGLTECVRADLIRLKHPVQVSIVHPGGVKTNISNSAISSAEALGQTVTAQQRERIRIYNEKLLKMPAEQAAKIVIDGVENNNPRILVGNDAKSLDLITRILPSKTPQLTVWLEKQIFKD